MAAARNFAKEDDEDEWEYEYDETETETFHVVLDLSNVPAAKRSSIWHVEKSISVPEPGAPTGQQAANEAGTDEEEDAEADDDDEYGPSQPEPGEKSAMRKGQDAIQILDLQSKNPIISYNGQILSCHWASTIGTDLIFVKSSDLPQASAEQQPPLRALGDNVLLATSATRLVANRVDLQRKRQNQLPPQEAPPATTTTQPNSMFVTSDQQKLQITLPPDATPMERRQARFLERLSEVKRSRGEDIFVASQPSGGRRGKAKKPDFQSETYYVTENTTNLENISDYLLPNPKEDDYFVIDQTFQDKWRMGMPSPGEESSEVAGNLHEDSSLQPEGNRNEQDERHKVIMKIQSWLMHPHQNSYQDVHSDMYEPAI